jgi:hypothetical protein
MKTMKQSSSGDPVERKGIFLLLVISPALFAILANLTAWAINLDARSSVAAIVEFSTAFGLASIGFFCGLVPARWIFYKLSHANDDATSSGGASAPATA